MASKASRSVYLDACVFLAHFLKQDGHEGSSASIQGAEDGNTQGYISPLVVAEVVGAPNLRAPQGTPSTEHEARKRLAVEYFANTRLRRIEITARAEGLATDYANRYHLKGPDALHVACAVMASCDELHTLDTQLLKVGSTLPGLTVRKPYGDPQSAIAFD